jgi:hypothetical protein
MGNRGVERVQNVEKHLVCTILIFLVINTIFSTSHTLDTGYPRNTRFCQTLSLSGLKISPLMLCYKSNWSLISLQRTRDNVSSPPEKKVMVWFFFIIALFLVLVRFFTMVMKFKKLNYSVNFVLTAEAIVVRLYKVHCKKDLYFLHFAGHTLWMFLCTVRTSNLKFHNYLTLTETEKFKYGVFYVLKKIWIEPKFH